MSNGKDHDRFRFVATRYDLVNRVLSLGLDGLWRREAVAALAPAPGAVVLDLCCGTGAIALMLAASGSPAAVVGVDVSAAMLAQAERRRARQPQVAQSRATFVAFQRMDVTRMPFPDGAFDGAIMGFGLRNLPHRASALNETRRVLSAGARLAVLEFVPPAGRGAFARATWLWIERVIPWMGGILSGSREDYEYLSDSILSFPPPDLVSDEIRSAGFTAVQHRLLFPGVVTVWSAEAKG